MKVWSKLVGASALLFANNALAQDVVQWSAWPSGNAQKYYMASGTPVYLRTVTEVNTKDNKAGDRIYLEVAEPLSFRGYVVVPAGTPVVAEVSRVQRNGHFGKKGKLEVRLKYMHTPNGTVRLSGAGYDEGKSGTAASVATMLLVSPLGFLVHGTSGYIKPGTVVTASLAESLRFAWDGTRPVETAMQVQADGEPLPSPGFANPGG